MKAEMGHARSDISLRGVTQCYLELHVNGDFELLLTFILNDVCEEKYL